MAVVRGLSAVLGDALVALLDWSWPRIQPKVDAAVDFVADAVTPHPPMSLRTLDGELVTGLVVLNRGQAIVFIGVREPGPRTTHTYAGDPFHDDEPLWQRDARDVRLDPYRRHP